MTETAIESHVDEGSDTDRLRFDGDHRPQREFVESTERYVAFISGIGAGKTVGGIGRLIRNVFEWNAGHTGFVVAPTVPSLRTTIIPELEKWGVLDRCEFNRSEKRLDFPNGSTVFLDSADNDRKIQRLRGPSIGWFWMDEAATIDKRAWEILIGRLRDGEYLNASVTTTPKGYNWIHERFVGADDAQVISGVPSHANPHLPDEYAEITGEYEGNFYEQEVLGRFTDFEGQVYPWFGAEHIVDTPPDAYDEVIYGVDWGHNNPATILALVRNGETWTAVEEWYETRRTVNDHSRALADMQQRWGPGTVYCDPSEPANIDQFQRDGLDATQAKNDVTPGIQHVSSVRDRFLVCAACQNLRNELSQYQYKGDDSDKPEKMNDHLADSLRYALYTHAVANADDDSDAFLL